MSRIVLFTSLQDYSYDPIQLAENFVRQDFSEEEVNIELTHLLLQSSGVGDRIPDELIRNKSYNDIINFFVEKISRVRQNSMPLHNSNYHNRLILFFERIISLNWNTLTNNGNFDSYLSNFVNEISLNDSLFLHVSCFTIKLKFVTGYLKSDGDKQYTKVVQKYAKNVLKEAIVYVAVQCSLTALNELFEWIKMDAKFAKDEYLRIIAWSLKTDKPKLVCSALQISHFLLNEDDFHRRFSLFVRKLMTIFEDQCFTSNRNIFDWICRCCELIYKNYREALLPSFINDVLDNLFAKDRERAKIAARFWVKTMFDEKSPVSNTRKIIKFLADKTRTHAKVLVDSLLDEYQVMTDWKLYVKMLTDETRTGLSIEEKHQVLLLMAYAADETVTGILPEYRDDKKKKLSLSIHHQYANRFTKVMVPNLKILLDLEYFNEPSAKTILLHMAMLFNFEIMNRDALTWLIGECYSLYQLTNHSPGIYAAVDLLFLITENVSDKFINRVSTDMTNQLTDKCGKAFETFINDLLENPARYADSENKELQETAAKILCRVHVLNRIFKFSKKYGFDIPRKIFEHEFLTDNPVFLFVTYVCIYLITEYVIATAKALKTSSEKDFIAPEEYEDEIINIDFTVKSFCLRLEEWYFSDLSIIVFLNLCSILPAIRSLRLRENTWNELFPPTAKYRITSYVSHAVLEVNEELISKNMNTVTKTLILKSHLELIKSDILPLTHAYDALTLRCKIPKIIDDPLRNFLTAVSDEKPRETVVAWLLKWLQCLSSLSHQDCLDVVQDFVELIHPIKKQIQDIIYHIHVDGIDYSLSSVNADQSSTKNEFLQILSQLCVCLDKRNKKTIYEYFTEKRSTGDREILRYYLKCLKKQLTFESIVPPSPTESSTASVDVNFWDSSAGSHLNQPSSVQADESDLVSSPLPSPQASPLASPLASEKSLIISRIINDVHDRISNISETRTPSKETNVTDMIEEIQNFCISSDGETDPSYISTPPSKKMRFSDS